MFINFLILKILFLTFLIMKTILINIIFNTLFSLLKSTETFFNLPMSISDFKLVKSTS